MESYFYYDVTIHRDGVAGTVIAPFVNSLALGVSQQQIVNQVLILESTEGKQGQGLYIWDGATWRFSLPQIEVAESVIKGDLIDVYYDVTAPVTLATRTRLWRNGLSVSGNVVQPGSGIVWVAQTAPANGLVASVNGEQPDANGDVTVQIDDIPGLSDALANAGAVLTVNSVSPDAQGNVEVNIPDIPNLATELSAKVASVNGELPNASGAVVVQIADIPGLAEELGAAGTVKSVNGINPDNNGNVVVPTPGIASDTVLGLVKVQADSGLVIDVTGNISVDASQLPVYVESVKSTTATGGFTLINNDGSTSHAALLKQIVPGANVTITSDGNGITINSTSTPPGVEGLVAVQSEGNGTSLVGNDGTASGIATIKSVSAGTGITITASTDGSTITVAATGATGTVESVNDVLPDAQGNVTLIATDISGISAVGKSGLYSDLINPPAQYSLPIASASVLGGIKIGSNLTIAGDGTLSAVAGYTLPVSTASVLGGVKIGSGINVTSDGTISNGYVLAAATAATLGGVKIGSGINVTSDGTISAAVAGVVSVTSTGSGVSLVNNVGGFGTSAVLRSIAPGTNVTVVLNAAQDTITINAPNLVTSVNGEHGDVTVSAGTLGLATVATSGLYSDLTGLPSPYTLPIASASVLGGIKIGSGLSIDGATGILSTVGGYTLPPATTAVLGGVIVPTSGNLIVDGAGNLSYTLPIASASVLGGVKQGTNVAIASDGTISGTYSLPVATASVLGGVKVGTGLTVAGDGTLSVSDEGSGVSSITADAGPVTGAVILAAGSNIVFNTVGQTITVSAAGGFVEEAPNDGNLYGRKDLGWTVIPDIGSAITSVTSQAGTGAILLVEDSPPANSAIIKSLVQGSNVTITESGGLITISAAVPGTPVQSINSIPPNGAGNVTLTALNVGALATTGGRMSGNIDMQSIATVVNVPTPVNPGDAVPLSFVSALVIDGGTF